MIKNLGLILIVILFQWEVKAQCNLNATVCDQNFHGPFSFVPPGNQVSSCLDFTGPDYAYIILYIISDGPLNLLIEGDNPQGFLDVSIFNIPDNENPCTAINNNANELSCNYAGLANGCNQFGTDFACGSTVPAPLVDSGDVLMIVVEDWSDEQTTFELYLGNGAQTGVPTVNINDPGILTDLDNPTQLNVNTLGGTWGSDCGACLDANGVFDPQIAGIGTHEVNYSIGSGTCLSTDTIQIQVISGCNNALDIIHYNGVPAPLQQTLCFNDSINISAPNLIQVPAADPGLGVAIYKGVPNGALPYEDPNFVDLLAGTTSISNLNSKSTLSNYEALGHVFPDSVMYLRFYTLSDINAVEDSNKLSKECFDSSTVYQIKINPQLNINRLDAHCSYVDSAQFSLSGGASLFQNNAFTISNLNNGTGPNNVLPNTPYFVSGINLNNAHLQFLVSDNNGCNESYSELFYARVESSIVSFDDTICGYNGNINLTTNYGTWSNFNSGLSTFNNIPNPTSFSVADSGTHVLNYAVNNANICRDTLQVIVFSIDTNYQSNILRPSCYDSCDAQITINVSNPLQFQGNLSLNGAGINTSTPLFYDELCAGNYNYQGQFFNYCTVDFNLNIIGKDSITLLFSSMNIPCFDGSIDVQINNNGAQGFATYFIDLDTNTTGQFNSLTAGNYTMGIIDQMGCTKETINTLTQPTQLTFNSTILNPNCTDSCDGEINFNARGGTPFQNNTYLYFDLNSPQADSTQLNMANLCDGVHRIYVKDSNQCTSDTATVTLVDPAPFTIQVDTIIAHSCYLSCDGEVQISGSELFHLNGIGPNTIINDGPICDSVKWYSAVNAKGCTIDTLISINMPSPLQVVITGADTVCANTTHEINVSGVGGTAPYNYSIGGGNDSTIQITHSTDTIIQAIIRDANNCTNSRNKVLRVFSPIVFHHHDSLSTCFGNDLALIADVTGGDANSIEYNWLVNNDTIFTGHHWSIDNVDTSFTAQIHATDQCLVNYVDSIFVTIHALPSTALSYQILNHCGNGSAIFYNPLNDRSIDYEVEVVHQNKYTVTDSLTVNFNEVLCYDIKVIAESNFNCKATRLYANEICINPTPMADFTFTPTVIDYLSPHISLINNSSGAYSYTWDLGASGTSIEEDVHLVLHDSLSEDQTFCLVAIDSLNQCPDTICRTVPVSPSLQIWAPNTFTPNIDGDNDVFSIQVWGGNPNEFQIRIFNRWGHTVFESNDIHFEWDGKVDEEHIGKGVYHWVIDIQKENSSDIIRERGEVFLFK